MADTMSTETKTILEIAGIPRVICNKYATRNALTISAQITRV
jgi:hypothetical protein